MILVNPPATYAREIAQKRYPPAGLLYLAAALRQAGFSPGIVEANAFSLSTAQAAREVALARPFLVGLPVFSEILSQVYDLAAAIRQEVPGAVIVLGGPHATAVPEKVLAQFPMADYLLTGEADETLPLLARDLARGQTPGTIPGLWRRTPSGPVEDAPHKLPKVTGLARPARDLVARAYEDKLYHSLLVRSRPVDILFTSRGCPHACGFCYNFRRRYRGREPGDVVEELASIRARGIRDVEICDDTFTADEGRALAILDLILARRLDISFRIKSRVDAFSERFAKKARAAGVYLVSFGLESGSQRMLDAMNKGITLAQSAEAIRLAQAYGLASHTSWIIGFPGETPETVDETVRFILKNRPATANLAVLRPYPNTPVYRLAAETGALAGDWEPGRPEPFVRLAWAQDRRVLDELCTQALKRIYFTPYYLSSFALRIARGANLQLARYALQETGKALGITRRQ